MKYNLTNDSNGVSIEELLTIKSYTDKGYIVPIGELFIESSELNNIINAIKSKHKTKEYDFCSKDNISIILQNEKHVINISGNEQGVYVSSYSKTLKDAEYLYNTLKKFNPPSDENEIRLQTFISTNTGIETKYKCYKAKDYSDINSSYYPYIETDILFEQFFGNKESILICFGAPGTGKSKLSSNALKYCINNIDSLSNIKKDGSGYNFINVGYVKSTDVLADDNFWYTLSNDAFDLVILDDLDFFLTSRNNESRSHEDDLKNMFVSQLLSFTDGIQENNTKFIITSNQPFDSIDDALLRKGRLFDILELRKLTNDEALEVWLEEGLEKKEFEKCKFGSTVLQADLGSEIQKRLNDKIKIRSYLKEENISKAKFKSKKLGF